MSSDFFKCYLSFQSVTFVQKSFSESFVFQCMKPGNISIAVKESVRFNMELAWIFKWREHSLSFKLKVSSIYKKEGPNGHLLQL